MTTPAWRASLRPASLRGVPFEVETGSLKGGRRNVAHEYPQRDRGYVEDLGRRNRTFSLVAFVIGDDWAARRDRLIAACEQGGTARLVHPVYGVLSVAVDEYEVEVSTDAGRQARFAITFTEAGDLQFPTGDTSTSADLQASADTADTAAAEAFAAEFSTDGAPGFVLADAIAGVSAAVADIRKAMLRMGGTALADPAAVATALVELEAQASALIATPAELASDVARVLGELGVLAVLDAITADAGAVTAGTAGTPTEQQALDNTAALRRLVIRAGLVASARLVAAATFASYDEAIGLRDGLADKLASEAEAADDATFEALSDLRTALVADVELRAAELVRLREHVAPAVTSTLELAQDLYGDGTREAEIEARNAPPHPGFVVGALIVADA